MYIPGILALIALVVGLLPASQTLAADPGSGSVSSAETSLNYTGGPFFTPNVSPTAGTAGVDYVCPDYTASCDRFELNVDLTPEEQGTFDLVITHEWGNNTADFDIYFVNSEGDTINSAASSANPEVISHCGLSGDYEIIIVPYAPLGQSYEATVELVPRNASCAGGGTNGGETGLPIPGVDQPFNPDVARYQIYPAPEGQAQAAGEPSIDVNWNTDTVMFIALLDTFRVNFNNDRNPTCSSPANELWEDVSVATHVNTLDPILFTDKITGQTLSAQLAAKRSIIGVSSDDGDNWAPSNGAGFNTGFDHQTIGGGPYASGFGLPLPTQTYTHAVYYCGQDVAYANCARSDDGGITFVDVAPMYTLTECGGLHGHIKVGPDGTAYVPNESCGGGQGVAVTEDNGLSWEVRTVPDSTPGNGSDPSVGIASDGTVYMGYVGTDGQPMATVSHDNGVTWSESIDVGGPIGVDSAVWPAVVAGDPDRAAFIFHGTAGDLEGDSSEDEANFDGVWYLFAAHTYDGGQTWSTVNLTPDDPIQRGSICNGGCQGRGDRNLLDFFDAELTRDGRVVIGYADGCVGDCIKDFPNTFSDVGAIARQEGGKRLFAAFDPANVVDVPLAPRVDRAESNGSFVTIEWSVPDNGGSEITDYKIYRRTQNTSFDYQNPLATVNADKTRYIDLSANEDGATYFYQVAAVNAVGDSVVCNEFEAVALTDGDQLAACLFPGELIVTHPNEAKADVVDAYDILSVLISEPYDVVSPPTTEELHFSLQVQATVEGTFQPPSASEWVVNFTYDGTTYYAKMDTLTATPYYTYGTVGAGGVETELGVVDGSVTLDGLITIVVPNANFTAGGSDAPTQGDLFTDVNGRAQLIASSTNGNQTGSNNYDVKGIQGCEPNKAPVAVLNVTPLEGESPLDVTIDATGSVDVDDDIVFYYFDFGDGTEPVTNTTGTTTHTFINPETNTSQERRIRVTVEDARGKRNQNVAQQNIEILPSGGIPTAIFTNQTTATSNQVMALIGVGLIVMLTVAVGGVTVLRRRNLG